MKIIINVQNPDLLNSFIQSAKELNINLINAKAENVLFSNIEQNNSNFFIFDTENGYITKAISFIKKTNPYSLIGIICSNIKNDISIMFKGDIYFYNDNKDINFLSHTMLISFQNLHKNFSALHKLTEKSEEPIKFGNVTYDPSRRILSVNNKEIKQLSTKEGGVIEILAQNLDNIVRKEIILEKVWHKNDYFSGRSLDVYITHIRKLFDANGIKYKIKNITGKGLVLEKK